MGASNVQHSMIQGILHGEYQMVFLSPESMLQDLSLKEMFRSKVYQKRDGNLCNAVLYYYRQSSCSTSMREYLNNT